MAFNPQFRDHILDLLAPLDIVARSMFGGVGFFADGRMFALIASDKFYLKVDEANRADYESAGVAQWTYEAPGGRKMPMPYWEAPEHLLEEGAELVAWARKSMAAAHRAEVAKGQKGKAAKSRAAAPRVARPRSEKRAKRRAQKSHD